MAVDVSVADLVRNYAHLRDATATSVGQSANLLLFYAVECGLKAAYLGKRGINAKGTQALPERLRSHDIRKLAKELKIGACVSAQLSPCRRRHDPATTVQHQELHQAWRYGASLDQVDEGRAVSALGNLSDWCKGEHGR